MKTIARITAAATCFVAFALSAEGDYPTVDCVSTSAACRPITIQGDPPFRLPNGATAAFSGYADPCVRKDPRSGVLWLGYSWPHALVKAGARSPAVEIHLARSDDEGRSWRFVKALMPAAWVSDPNDGAPGVLFNEVVNFCPVAGSGGPVWYSANLSYFYGAKGDARRPIVSSFVIKVRRADAIEGLAEAVPAVLGCRFTAKGWKPDVDLSALDPSLAEVSTWNEPALAFENGRLYLALVGFVYDKVTGAAIMERNKIHVFSAAPADPDPRRWTWRYHGVLAGPAEARELGGERLTQPELDHDKNGALLLLVTPDDWVASARDYDHKGCVVLQVASLAKPALACGADGKLVVRGRITASDSGELGSAASSYDPGFPGGVVFTKRDKSKTGFTIGFYATGLVP
jgi:hypothetical protein